VEAKVKMKGNPKGQTSSTQKSENSTDAAFLKQPFKKLSFKLNGHKNNFVI